MQSRAAAPAPQQLQPSVPQTLPFAPKPAMFLFKMGFFACLSVVLLHLKMDVTVDGCVSGRAYNRSPARRLVLFALLSIAATLLLPMCYFTAGEPRRNALEQAIALTNKKATAANMSLFAPPAPSSPASKGDDDIEALFASANAGAESDPCKGWGLSDMVLCILQTTPEQRDEAALIEALKELMKQVSDDGEASLSLPSAWLPSAMVCMSLFITIVGSGLFALMCHWSPAFEARALHSRPSSAALDLSSVILVHPPANRGKPALVPLTRCGGKLCIDFQRQRYFFDQHARPLPRFACAQAPTSLPLASYTSARGFKSAEEISNGAEVWGKNHISVQAPTFLQLLRLQLLSPIATFQFFVAFLWLLDEYWTYTMWNIVTVIMLESSTVWQRSRTQAMLGGMAPAPTVVYVYRSGKWDTVISHDILPGDIISISPKRSSAASAVAPSNAAEDIIPCDCLLLRGSAVINEASLTGESVPQMKEAVTASDASTSDELDMQGKHRVHVLFSGTCLVTLNETSAADAIPHIPPPPNKGCVAYVLRTGFASSQGSLMQMIEFSQQSVHGDIRETGIALLILLVFALISAAYVMKVGLEKKEKTTHELLLKCVMIITSVIPQQFPMQMAVAVNVALMALMKVGIMCIEPFRVPLAGKVAHCLFDKTGTLTTDQLVPHGVVNASSEATPPPVVPISGSAAAATLVLAACHSVVSVAPPGGGDATLAGDPIELAALQGIAWNWSSDTSVASPGNITGITKARKSKEEQLKQLQTVTPTPATQQIHTDKVKSLSDAISALDSAAAAAKESAQRSLVSSVRVLQRHHFSSALQRMSVVVHCQGREPFSGLYCLVKGSPEALLPLMDPTKLPSWYTSCYESLALKGLRVLSLGFRRVTSAPADGEYPREWVEAGLTFAGFIAFTCKTRADSRAVVQSLQDADHSVIMLTGDALFTSLHVAREVGICRHRDSATLKCSPSTGDKPVFEWEIRDKQGAPVSPTLPFEPERIASLAAKYNLLATEADFTAAAATCSFDLWKSSQHFCVFARMSPQGKANVVRAIQMANPTTGTLMCGDGGNDVGALKQSDVGIALLAGHANTNTAGDITEGESQDEGAAEDALNAHSKSVMSKWEEVNKLRVAHMKQWQAEYQKQSQRRLQEETQALMARGEYMATFGAMKKNGLELRNAINAENARFMQVHGQVWDSKKDTSAAGDAGGLASLLDTPDDASAGGAPVVRPGDASVAAPFTSRVPSVRAAVDLIRQGRCTLLSALMQQQIMMLESTIAAYTMAALSLHNARSSERQMMASSWLIMTAAISFSYSTPLDKMHPLRPLRSLFHPAIILSVLGQAAIHIFCMSAAVQWATDEMGPVKLKEVTEFFKKAKAKEITMGCADDDYICQLQSFWEAPFMPNLLNTTVFLVETSQMISVFFANYKGRPWMKGMLDNHALFLSVFICIGGVAVASWEMSPKLNQLLQFAPFPDDAYRYKVIALVCASIIGTFAWDRLCTLVFARPVFKAMTAEVLRTTITDMLPVIKTAAKVAAVVLVLYTDTILIAGVAYWFYRRNRNAAAA